MASRYNQEYFLQHSLMNIPFTNLNDIIHPNAENILETLRHFASAMFDSGCYWNDMAKVQHDLEIECHRSDYILTYLCYISMLKASYDLYRRDFLDFYELISHIHIDVCHFSKILTFLLYFFNAPKIKLQ